MTPQSEPQPSSSAIAKRRWSAEEDAILEDVLQGRRAAGDLDRTASAIEHRARLLRRGGRDLPRGPRRRPPSTWTQEEVRRLVIAHRRGDTFAQLAEDLGRAAAVVAGKVDELRRDGHDLQVRKPRWTTERRKLLAKRRRQGASLRELEREFGVTRGTITSQIRTLRRLGYDVDPAVDRAARGSAGGVLG